MQRDSLGQYSHERLSNGINVFCVQNELPHQNIDFILHAGSATDGSLPGVHHKVEHLLSQRIYGKPFTKIESYFERKGGQVCFGEVYFTSTRFGCQIPLDIGVAERACNIFSEALFHAKFPKNDFQTEENIIVEEFRDQFACLEQYQILKLGRKEIFGDHPLSGYVHQLGSVEEIRQIKRRDVESHYRRYFTPQSLTILSTGGLLPADSIKMVEKATGDIFCLNSPERDLFPEILSPAYPECKKIEFDPKQLQFVSSDQGYFKTVIRLPGRTSEGMCEIVKRMIEKSLYLELREKRGWLYDYTVAFEYLKAAWVVEIECKLKKESWPDSLQILEEIFSQLRYQKKLFLDSRLHLIRRLDLLGPEKAHVEASELIMHCGFLESVKKRKSRIRAEKFETLSELFVHFEPEHRFTITRPPVSRSL